MAKPAPAQRADASPEAPPRKRRLRGTIHGPDGRTWSAEEAECRQRIEALLRQPATFFCYLPTEPLDD